MSTRLRGTSSATVTLLAHWRGMSASWKHLYVLCAAVLSAPGLRFVLTSCVAAIVLLMAVV